MSLPRVSVVLPVHNGADYIESAIRSLLDQQGVDLEIVVSDDSSTDDTLAILARLADPRLRVIRNTARGGQFANFNRALLEATGDYVQMFSHDDLAHPGFLAAQVQPFLRHPEVGLVYSSCNIIDSDGRLTGRSDDEGTPLLIEFPTYLFISVRHGALPPSISATMVSRAALDAVMGFDERFAVGGDLEFFNRVAERFQFARNRALLLDVRVHHGSVTLNRDTPISFMREEALILPYYRRHLGETEFGRMMKRRSYYRGADHGRYLVKLALQGDWKRFISGWRALSQTHDPLSCIFKGLLRLKAPAHLG